MDGPASGDDGDATGRSDMLLREVVRSAGESVWKDLGREVLKSACHVLVEEGIEAAVEIWKKRRLENQEEELDGPGGGSDRSDAAGASAEVSTSDGEDAATSGVPFPDGGSERAPWREASPALESLSSYAERQSHGD